MYFDFLKMNNFFTNNPKFFILLYVIYVLAVSLIADSKYSFIVQPITIPITILIGIFIWEWQESVKNKIAKKQMYRKSYNEKAEKIFGIYTQYEKSIQNLYRFFNKLDLTLQPKAFRPISKHKEISVFIEKLDEEIKRLQELEVDLYNEAVLFYYLVSNIKIFQEEVCFEINVYQEATNLINILSEYRSISERIAELVDSYQHSESSQQDKEYNLISNFYNLKPFIKSFNFGYPDVSKEIIYDKPRKKFLELTQAQ